jgi:hypothetical protein
VATEAPSQPAPGSRLKRIFLATAMGVVALNLWTGSPLLGLWVGSRVQGGGPPSMTAILVVALTIAVVAFALTRLLAVLGDAYERASGHSATVRQHAPWLRSMRGERPQYEGQRPRLTGMERTLVIVVMLAAGAFEIWFFFFSGSPIGAN